MMPNTPPKNNPVKQKKWLSFSNTLTVAMLVFIVAMLVNPNVKAYVIQGLMKVGLFQPSVPSKDVIVAQTNLENAAPNVVFANASGERIQLADLKGKVVFINFWATWCPPCIAEMPSINSLYKKYESNNNIIFLMVDADGDLKKSVNFISKGGFDLPVYIPASEIPESMFGSSLPTTVVLNKQGQIVFHHEGSADYQNAGFIEFIEGLL